jgi:predicted P-loop ATPase
MEEYIIHIAKNRFDTQLKRTVVSWASLCNMFNHTKHTTETLAEYKQKSKEEQLKTKDVGGFVGGELKDGRRGGAHVVNRCLITLDADYANKNFITTLQENFIHDCLIYSTHTHTPEKPRYRVVIPLTKTITPDEYQPIARWCAEKIGIEYFDITTFDPSRLMFFPSSALDALFVFRAFNNGRVLCPDEILKNYIDWTDPTTWATSKRFKSHIAKECAKSPENLKGFVGAFCKAYSIRDAIDTFLADVYTPHNSRYTYSRGSTAGGLVIYDEKFAYSNHATDPACNKLCHAFNLVKIHKFGDDLQAFNQMIAFAKADKKVNAIKSHEILEVAHTADNSWMDDLELKKDGSGIADETQNYITIIENDPLLKGLGAYDDFSRKYVIKVNPPWARPGKNEFWTDADDSGLWAFLSSKYKLKSRQTIFDVISVVFHNHIFHPVKDFIESRPWDGELRVENLLIHYLGADDTEYTRIITRKVLVAAVARVYDPGCKFDHMLTLVGPQGIGKSLILKKLAGEWFSDQLNNLDTKDAYEMLDGVWIMEMSELTALKKAERESVKRFISKQSDNYRKSYDRRNTINKRTCIFVGTTNEATFLSDDTGNRRFWIVNTKGADLARFDRLDKNEVQQIWAEALCYYNQKEQFWVLPKNIAQQAEAEQQSHFSVDPWEGIISAFLEIPIPLNDWKSMSLDSRRAYYTLYKAENADPSSTTSTQHLVEKDRTCALEIWCECFGNDGSKIDHFTSKRINNILRKLGWEELTTTRTLHYGTTRGFKKAEILF